MSEIKSMKEVEFGRNIRVRDVVEGEVVEVKENYVLVNLNYFTEGTMYLDHYTHDKSVTDFKKLVNLGDIVSGEVTKVDEERGVILLSRLGQLRNEKFVSLLKELEENDIIEVTVKKKNERGYAVMYKGFEFFLPNSQAGFNVVIGNTYKVKILEVKANRKSAVVSKRALDSKEYYEQRQKELEAVNVGDVIKGTVSKIENYGALIKFGNIQGLLRITELSHNYVSQIKDIIKVDQEIEVKVIKKADGKIELSKKALIEAPYNVYAKNHKVGDKVVGKVIEKLSFGFVLELDKNITGLLHQSEYDYNPKSNFASTLKLKDSFEVEIKAIDANKQKISLSRKALLENPWADASAKEGEILEASILAISSKGLTIEALGITGFVPAKEISFEGKSNKLEDYYNVGDSIKGIVTNFDSKNWILEVSIKKLASDVERQQFAEYLEKQEDEDKNTNIGEMFKDILK